MLLMFDEKHKKHLGFLLEIGPEVLQEFGRISLEFIKKGSNTKVYQSAAQKLGVTAEAVQHGVEGLMYLMTESSKLLISEIDFQDSIMTLGFSEEMRQALLDLYLAQRREIRDILNEMSMDLPHYHNLEWRFDVEMKEYRSCVRLISWLHQKPVDLDLCCFTKVVYNFGKLVCDTCKKGSLKASMGKARKRHSLVGQPINAVPQTGKISSCFKISPSSDNANNHI